MSQWDEFTAMTLNMDNSPPGFIPVSPGAQPDCPGCYYAPSGPFQDSIWDPSTQEVDIMMANQFSGGSPTIQALPPQKPKPSVPSCVATFVDSLLGEGNTPPNDGAVKTAAEGAAAYLTAKTYQYEADNALVVPLRSSIVRTLVGASEMFATAAEVAPLAFAAYEWANATVQTAKANSSGACRPVLSFPTHP